jgi:hypothetical protein
MTTNCFDGPQTRSIFARSTVIPTRPWTGHGGGKRRVVIMHLADENNKLSQQRKISPTVLVQV